MPLKIPAERPSILIRREAFEHAGLQRLAIDSRFNLTDAEFRIEGDIIAIGPLTSEDDIPSMVSDFEAAGLVYFDDFFELSGNWPHWLVLFAQADRVAPG